MAQRTAYYRPQVRPQCPVHQVALVTRCTVKNVQYRYCPIDGCGQSQQTRRPATTSRRPETAHRNASGDRQASDPARDAAADAA